MNLENLVTPVKAGVAAPATQMQTTSRFGGIDTFVPTVQMLGGLTPLGNLIGATIAVVSGTTAEVRGVTTYRWSFRHEGGEEGTFLSSAPALVTLLPHIGGRAAILRVETGPGWQDETGNTRPSYRFLPGE